MEPSRIDSIIEHALAAWLWSETDHDGEPMDANHSTSDIAQCERNEWRSEIVSFIELAQAHDMLNGISDAQMGHDFTLTRNGHGAGFWDRGLGARGDWLTKVCKSFGDVSAYVGDGGKIGRL